MDIQGRLKITVSCYLKNMGEEMTEPKLVGLDPNLSRKEDVPTTFLQQ